MHGPAAFDLAVTSGMRAALLPHSAVSGSHAATAYESRKCQHQDTQTTCLAEGLQFLPLVAEACGGGWGPTATQVWKALATAIAARSNESASVEHDRLLQALAVALQRENARAVLRRLGSYPASFCFECGFLKQPWPTAFFIGYVGAVRWLAATWVLSPQSHAPYLELTELVLCQTPRCRRVQALSFLLDVLHA